MPCLFVAIVEVVLPAEVAEVGPRDPALENRLYPKLAEC
jgi:hypothetical protein